MAKKIIRGQRENSSHTQEEKGFNFATMLEGILEYIMQNKIAILIGLIIVIGVVTGTIVYSQNQKANKEEAAKIYDTFYIGMQQLQYMEDAAKQGEFFNKLIVSLEELIQVYPDTVPAVRARLYLGRLLADQFSRTQDQKAYQRAMAHFRDASVYAKSDFYKAMATMGIAQCYEQGTLYSSAFKEYEIIVNNYPEAGFSAVALIGMARTKEMMDDYVSANKYYKKVADEFSGSMWAKYARGKMYYFKSVDTASPAPVSTPTITIPQ